MSSPLPDDFRKALGLEGQPTIVEGLVIAEARLKQVMEQLAKLPDKNPAQVKLKQDREVLEPIVQELRDTVYGVKVDELCDAAEEALAEKPTRRAKARELLKQARREGKPLAGDSVYLRRVQALEGKLDEPGMGATAKDLGAGPTIPPQRQPGTSRPKEPGIHDPDDLGTGGAPSTIPTGLAAGVKVGGGRFTLVRELGRGGMGVVWLATDGLLKRDLAIKLLPPEVAADELALNDLRRETVESQRLSHPHIIRIHDLYQTPGEPAFISMEYVDGTNLRALLGKQPQRCFSWDFLRPLMAQLCSALDYAHSERVIHRDLKPSNLMLDSKSRLKLADFGIAATMSDSMSRVSRHTKDKDTSGTLNYMSPQQMRGDSPTASDDIYSLGATLYELLTSRTPFYRGDIPYQVKHEVPQKPAERIASLGIKNDVPERVSAMIMACLAKEPKERPQSGAWLMEQLESTTRAAVAPPPNEAAPPTMSMRSMPSSEPATMDAIANDSPPTMPKPPGPAAKPPLPDALPTLPAKVPAQPQKVPAPVSSGGNSKGVLIAIAAVVLLLGIILFFVFHHKSPSGETAGGESPATNQGGGGSAALATGELKITVQPAGAELISNDVSLGTLNGPLSIKGPPGQLVKFEARLEGYTNRLNSIAFPDAGQSRAETLTLQPMPALLYVNSEPPATQILLTRQNGKSENVPANPDGIQIEPGIAYTVAVTVPDHETIHTNIPPQKPGRAFRLELQPGEQTASLHVSVEPPGTRFSIVYPGRPTILWGTNTFITGLTPRVRFQIIAERRGYDSVTKEFTLNPNETADAEFGRLSAQSADLVVVATPRPFQLYVMWDGIERSYGNSGKAQGLPAGRKLVVTAKVESGEGNTTNITLEPGETTTINLGMLASPTGSLVIKSDPEGAIVSYAVDERPMTRIGQVDRIENLPIGHNITVTLRKDGYAPATMSKRLDRAMDTLDFRHLTKLRGDAPVVETPIRTTPVQEAPARRWFGTPASVKVYGENDDAEIFVDGRATGVKNGGVISNLVAGKTYEIRLHRLGFVDLVETVTMNTDGSEKYVLTGKAQPTLSVSEADLDVKLREIDAWMSDVQKHIPFGDDYRREVNDYIDRTEKLYKRNRGVWPRLELPLKQLKDLANARSSRDRRK